MAFVSSFTPALMRPSTMSVSKCVSPRTTVSMQEKSAAMPFLDAPGSLTRDIPGYAGFDPFSISNFVDVRFLREAEIKHGRICMLAILGMIVAEVITFPFYADAPKLVISRHDWGVTQGAMGQILLWCSFFEIMTMPAFVQMMNDKNDRDPGDFCFDPLNLSKTPEKKAVFQTNEIKNGRLAMVAVSGAIHHAMITKQNLFEQIFSGNILPQ